MISNNDNIVIISFSTYVTHQYINAGYLQMLRNIRKNIVIEQHSCLISTSNWIGERQHICA